MDLLAFETIPTIREARVLLDLLAETGATGWLSFQCRDGETTAAGEPVADGFTMAADAPGLVAIGVNCGPPRHVSALLAAAAATTEMPLIAYPNGGDTWDSTARRWVPSDGDAFVPSAAAGWAGLGARWIGGCCGTGPAEIAALAGYPALTPQRVRGKPRSILEVPGSGQREVTILARV